MNSIKLYITALKSNFDKAFQSTAQYKKRKLKKLLVQTIKSSDFYNELYRDIDISQITPDNISNLPPITKAQIIDNYNDVVCDSSIHKEDVVKFASDIDNLNKLFLNKYVIDTTSGTTGEKLKVINEIHEFEYMMANGIVYTWPKKWYAADIVLSFRPVVYLLPTDGFYASLMIANTYLGLSMNKKSEIIDFRLPINELVDKLNKINPILIGGYVSMFLTLADEAVEKRLNISPKYMVSIGTVYSDKDRAKITNTFNCKTFTSYSCTETGEIASECSEGHFHIVPDVIVEAADDIMCPVEDGTESNCILVTNLWNTTMPLIRYRINDRCIIHSEQCKCGRKEKWIEVIGREVLRVPFIDNAGKIIYLNDLMFEAILNEYCDGFANHQLVIKENNIEVRISDKDQSVQHKQFNRIKKHINALANKYNITLNIYLSDEAPQIEDSGKIKRYILKN